MSEEIDFFQIIIDKMLFYSFFKFMYVKWLMIPLVVKMWCIQVITSLFKNKLSNINLNLTLFHFNLQDNYRHHCASIVDKIII